MRVPFLLLLVLVALHGSHAPVAAQGGAGGGAQPSQWNTLSGKRPLVIAKGGFSGMFPESSDPAYNLATLTSLSDVVLWCNVQVTKDEVGICLPELNMANGTDIRFQTSSVYRNRTYNVNGNPVTGWFASDYNLAQLVNTVLLTQGILSRPPNFDSTYGINTVGYFQNLSRQSIWLNFQNALFYSQQKLNVTKVLLSAPKNLGYVSSPEVSFLQSVAPLFKGKATKLIFRFLSQDLIEPSSNQSYGSLLMNLTFVKTFASGILIPNSYVWVTTSDNYLVSQPKTIVADAHKTGLEVFVADFLNDVVIPYNYSYNPVSEYVNYINLGGSSVDGFLSDFPASASEAIGCFSHLDGNTTATGKPTIISHNGASGDYPGCTDLAYKNAVDFGSDYIDCPVQFTKDGILICMSSANLLTTTTVSNSPFGTRFSTFPEFQENNGIYTFNLTWDEIQKNMKPAISNPQFDPYKLVRNPAYKNYGNFMSLSDFLKFASSSTSSSLKGIVISIEYAAFFAGKLGFNVTDSVMSALNDAGFDKQPKLEVMIRSTNSSTLIPFKVQTKYKILYVLEELISNTDSASLEDIKRFADAVAVKRGTIFPSTRAFITSQTKLVEKLHSANISVYSYLFMNEFVNPPWDFLADPFIEIHNHVVGASVDGVITDFPLTAALYKKGTCSREKYSIPLIPPRLLLGAMASTAMPPALAPFPSLTESEVSEPPLPPALKPANSNPSGTPTTPSGQIAIRPSSLIIAVSLALFLVVP